MTINLETEVVRSTYDPTFRTHQYVVERDGKRWTVTVADDDFETYGSPIGASAAIVQNARRRHLAACLERAMDGPADA